MTVELIVFTVVYVATMTTIAFLRACSWKYREPKVKIIEERLRELEAATVDIRPDEWNEVKKDVATLKLANGLRTRR